MPGRPHRSHSTVGRATRLGRLLLIAALIVPMITGPVAIAETRLSREQAIEQALRQNGGTGKVLGVRQETRNGETVYSVKILTDGHVRVYRVRAN